jgi:hypothetical protein
MDKQTFTPVTFGYLRREAKWLHLYCTVCGREREYNVSQPPFDNMPDSNRGAVARPVEKGRRRRH